MDEAAAVPIGVAGAKHFAFFGPRNHKNQFVKEKKDMATVVIVLLDFGKKNLAFIIEKEGCLRCR